jgi:hypothetical protein
VFAILGVPPISAFLGLVGVILSPLSHSLFVAIFATAVKTIFRAGLLGEKLLFFWFFTSATCFHFLTSP